jgi:hypothetical protein
MKFLGLHYAIRVVLILYFAGMLLMGWLSKRGITNQEGYLLGNRRFGWPMMVRHAFEAGTNPGDAAGVMSQAVGSGASGVWVSWMWLFRTPFYWIIAPVIRRMRCLTTRLIKNRIHSIFHRHGPLSRLFRFVRGQRSAVSGRAVYWRVGALIAASPSSVVWPGLWSMLREHRDLFVCGPPAPDEIV